MAKSSSEVTVAVGQRVNYVMADGQIRPMDVVIANGNIASGYVLFADDMENLPEGIVPNSVTVSFSPHQTVPIPSFIENVVYDDTRKPGTYHFGEEEDAGEGFEKSVLQEQIDELRKQIKALTPKKVKGKPEKSAVTQPFGTEG